MARKGEKIVTQIEIETKVRNINEKINGVLSFLVFVEGAEIKNFMFQAATDTFAGTGTAITFPKPYKTGSTPIVIGVSQDSDYVFVMNAAASAISFTGYGRRISDGANAAIDATWIAVGERG
jgi:hypothetical protein